MEKHEHSCPVMMRLMIEHGWPLESASEVRSAKDSRDLRKRHLILLPSKIRNHSPSHSKGEKTASTHEGVVIDTDGRSLARLNLADEWREKREMTVELSTQKAR
ncbi:hypothetical protein MTO96_007380 [Rhipicephalus appendiculatus]